jgi:hypothetical protein
MSGNPPAATCNPDPVLVTKGINDGVRWTLNDKDYAFTGVTVDGTYLTPASSASGDFSGVSIDNTGANNQQSVMIVDDSLAEIKGGVHSDDHTYSVNYQDRNTGRTYSFDPTIRNRD